MVVSKTKRGRPPKSSLLRKQTMLWTNSIKVLSGVRSLRELETTLAADGVWDGVWSRYARGLVAPSKARITRIEALLPGTAQYFYADFWRLLENRPYLWSELDEVVERFPPGVFPELRRQGRFGRLCIAGNDSHFLTAAEKIVGDGDNGHHALATILVLIREAELLQDGRQYIRALQAWARASKEKSSHTVLRSLPYAVFEAVIAPVRDLVFSEPELGRRWQRFMEAYLYSFHGGRVPKLDEFLGIHCISVFPDFEEHSFKDLIRLIRYDTLQIVRYQSSQRPKI